MGYLQEETVETEPRTRDGAPAKPPSAGKARNVQKWVTGRIRGWRAGAGLFLREMEAKIDDSFKGDWLTMSVSQRS